MSTKKVDAWADEVEAAIDTLENLLGAMELPLPAELHFKCLKGNLPAVRDRLRKTLEEMRLYVEG